MEKNKLIVKNTLLLYFRMILTMGVSLYTSRVVLNVLGVKDFGTYSLVGGVVSMLTFLNASLSGATSRFLTFELGKGDVDKLTKIFTSAFTIHLGLAIIIFVVGETLGLWFLENKLVIEAERLSAARYVYQFSLLSCMLSIVKVPSNASIISHERMGVFAYVSILTVLLKLLVVFLLMTIEDYDKLILYGFMILLVSVIETSIYLLYGVFNFKECKFKLNFDKGTMKPMLSYSGWDLYGNLSIVARGQGINVMLNTFFGTAINAASGIATNVQNSVAGFADNFLTAIRPQVVKSYASNDIKTMLTLVFNSSKFSFCLLLIISFPLILENTYVLSVWLGEVPEYAVIYCQLSLINNLVSIMFRSIMFSIHATGDIKRVSLVNGTIYLSVLPISYLLLKQDMSPVVPYVVNIVLLMLGCGANLYALKKCIPEFSISEFFRKVVFVCVVVIALSSIFPVAAYFSMEQGFIRFFVVFALSICCVGITSFYIGIDSEMRFKIISFVRNKLKLEDGRKTS